MLQTLSRFFFVKQNTAYELRISDWSSDVCSSYLGCPSYLGQRPTSDLCEHPVWQGLAGSQPERREAWRHILDDAVPPEQLAEIRLYLQQPRALGHDAFKATVEATTRRFASAWKRTRLNSSHYCDSRMPHPACKIKTK